MARRHAHAGLALGWALLSLLLCGPVGARGEFVGSFDHGVASGDPLPGRVILWTKYTPRTSTLNFAYIDYRVAKDSRALTDMAALPPPNGTVRTDEDSDFTAKVDIGGLEQGQTYFFAFYAGAARSPVGRFKVPVDGTTKLDNLKYAVFTCANWGWGFFNAYDAASHIDLDFWMHVGDFIYEYGEDKYPSPVQAVRYAARPLGLQPPNGLITLQDYRKRYAQYRQDPGLQALSASAALIAVWDDHEIANNPWTGGAENHHSDTDGDWFERMKAAVRAYHEWMPTRSGEFSKPEYVGVKIYREFQFGDLASLMMLETRLVNRSNGEIDPFPDIDDDDDGIPDNDSPSQSASSRAAAHTAGKPPALWDEEVASQMAALRQVLEDYRWNPEKTLLGVEQLDWLRRRVALSKAGGTRWQLIGQEIILFDANNGIDAAIAQKRINGDLNRSTEWQGQLENVTGWDCTTPQDCGEMSGHTPTYVSRDPTPYKRHIFESEVDVTPSVIVAARSTYALSKYRVHGYFDDWSGYAAERTRFLKALEPAEGSAIVYGGDSHSAWAGVHSAKDGSAVCGEYDVTSVTSTGRENFMFYFPPDLVAAALLAEGRNVSEGEGFVGSMRYVETHSRGFTLVDLTHDSHDGSFIYVDTVGTKQYSIKKCDRLTYAPQGASYVMSEPQTCKVTGTATPYHSGGLLHADLCGCGKGKCRHGCVPTAPATGVAEEEEEEKGKGWLEIVQEELEEMQNEGEKMKTKFVEITGGGILATVWISGAVLILAAGLVVLYRKLMLGSSTGGRYVPQHDHSINDLHEPGVEEESGLPSPGALSPSEFEDNMAINTQRPTFPHGRSQGI